MALAKAKGIDMAIFLQPLAGIDGKTLSSQEKSSIGDLLEREMCYVFREFFDRVFYRISVDQAPCDCRELNLRFND